MADCFSDKTFIEKISPSLVTISQPLTNAAINDAVAKVVLQLESDVINPLRKQNNSLIEAIAKKDETIQEKEEIIKIKDQIIRTKDDLLKERNDTIIKLEQNVDMLTSKLDDLEQYGRRCSVRMFNVPQPPDGSCMNSALKVMNELLDVPIREEDIERQTKRQG